MPIWPNPSVTIDAIQNAIDNATGEIDFTIQDSLSIQETATSTSGVVWLTITNSDSTNIFKMDGFGNITVSGLSVATLNNISSAVVSSSSAYRIERLSGSEITENWVTAAVTASLSITIDWLKAYSTNPPSFVQITLGSAGTLNGYTATTSSITVSFTASYTGNVNVYAMGAS